MPTPTILSHPKLPLPPLQLSPTSTPTLSPISPATSAFSLTTAQRHQLLVHRLPPPSSHPFVYAVLTTKIYCLPTCPSRLARRANIIFFDNPREAETRGFRSCKRCKPDLSPWFVGSASDTAADMLSNQDGASPDTQTCTTAPRGTVTEDTRTTDNTSNDSPSTLSNPASSTHPPSPTSVYDPTDPALKLHLALQLIHAHSQEHSESLSDPHSHSHSPQSPHSQHSPLSRPPRPPLSLADLARAVGLSKWHLHRSFKRRLGKTPREMAGELARQGERDREHETAGKIFDMDTERSEQIEEEQSTPSSHFLTLSDSSSDYPSTPLIAIANDLDDDGMLESVDHTFSPDVECVLRDLFPEIYEQNMMFMEAQGCEMLCNDY